MLARFWRRLLGQLALHPDLKHLDDGSVRWHFGDDPNDLDTTTDQEW